MKTNRQILGMSLLLAAAFSVTSCKKDPVNNPPRESNEVEFFLATEIDAAGQAAEYLLAVPDITQGTASVVGNGLELIEPGYNTWIFPTEHIGIGLKYQKGDPGLGLGVTLGPDGNIVEKGNQIRIESRYTTYGVFQSKVVTGVGGIQVSGSDDIHTTFNVIDPAKGNALSSKTINTTNLTGNGEYATLSGIVQFGENEFLTALVPSKINSDTGEGGSSTGETAYPDSVWIAAFDQDFNLLRVYGDDRLGYASGRFRSQYYSTIGSDDNGNLYVFSPSNDDRSTRPAGVIRINQGEEKFDESYFWDIEGSLGAEKDSKFSNVYHVTGDYFVLDFRRTAEEDPNQEVARPNALAVLNVVTKELTWVSGLPEYTKNPMFGNPIAEDGKLYIPVSLTTGEKPAVYIVDVATSSAKRGIEVDASQITAVGKLKQ